MVHRPGCIDLRFHDLRHEATSVLSTVFTMDKLTKVTGHKDTRMLLRYLHPDGRDLARQLARSTHGRAQTEKIRKRNQSIQTAE
jgi:hypothetical protein